MFRTIRNLAIGAAIVLAPSAKADEPIYNGRPVALTYVLLQVAYTPSGDSFADVVDYDLSMTDCAAELATMPEPQRTTSAIVAFQCAVDAVALDGAFRLASD